MMTRHRMTNWIGMLCAAVVLFGFAQTVNALNTEAGTTIINTATVTFYVGDVEQTPVSGEAKFVVDRKIDLSMTSLSPDSGTTLIPGTPTTLKTTVTNEGNSPIEYFKLAVTDLTLASIDSAIATIQVYEDDASNNGSYEGNGTDTLLGPTGGTIQLGIGESKSVFIVVTPQNIANGAFLPIVLTASAVDSGDNLIVATALTAPNTSGFNPDGSSTGVTEIVFADGDSDDAGTLDAPRNGAYAVTDTYTIESASLNVTKTATVSAYPADLQGGDDDIDGKRKAIPGATVQYTITIENSGSVPATNVRIVDDIPSTVTFVDVDFPVTYSWNDEDSDGEVELVLTYPSTTQIPAADATSGTAGSLSFTYRVTIN